MLLQIDSSLCATGWLLTVTGEIDLGTVDILRNAVTDALQAESSDLVIDLDDVSYIDSTGLGVLVGTYKRLADRRRSLTVRCSKPQVLRLLEITGLTDLFQIDRTASKQPASSSHSGGSVSV
jgi:anti-sigma B factor antagonist